MPYRRPPTRRDRDARDFDLVGVYAVVWIFCAVQVAYSCVRESPWSAGSTLALILVVWLPWLLRDVIRAAFRRGNQP